MDCWKGENARKPQSPSALHASNIQGGVAVHIPDALTKWAKTKESGADGLQHREEVHQISHPKHS